MDSLRRALKLAWAAPYSALGLLFGTAMRLAGGRASTGQGILEFAWRANPEQCGAPLRRLPYRAITLGHVVLGVTSHDLDRCRAHELVHVRQYERWGPLFMPAYLASSAWQWLRGRDPYWDNVFEVQARGDCLRPRPAA